MNKKRLRIVWNDPLHGIHRWRWRAELECWLLKHRHCCLIHAWLVRCIARRIQVECEMRSEWCWEGERPNRRPVAFALKCRLLNGAEVKWWVPCRRVLPLLVVPKQPLDWNYSRIKHRLARRILRSLP